MLRVAVLLFLLIAFLLLLTDRDTVEFVRSNSYILDIVVLLLMLSIITLIFLPITSLFVTSVLIRIAILTIITGVLYTNTYKSVPELLGTHSGLVENDVPECNPEQVMTCCELSKEEQFKICGCAISGMCIVVTGSSK